MSVAEIILHNKMPVFVDILCKAMARPAVFGIGYLLSENAGKLPVFLCEGLAVGVLTHRKKVAYALGAKGIPDTRDTEGRGNIRDLLREGFGGKIYSHANNYVSFFTEGQSLGKYSADLFTVNVKVIDPFYFWRNSRYRDDSAPYGNRGGRGEKNTVARGICAVEKQGKVYSRAPRRIEAFSRSASAFASGRSS